MENRNLFEMKNKLNMIEKEIPNNTLTINKEDLETLKVLSVNDENKLIELLYKYAFLKGLRYNSLDIDNFLYDIKKCSSMLLMIEGAFEGDTGHFNNETIVESLNLIRDTIDRSLNEIDKIL